MAAPDLRRRDSRGRDVAGRYRAVRRPACDRQHLAVLAAAAITFVSAVCAAWRWRVVARGLGLAITMPAAVSAYYRSLFVNTVLPGGVLGDVDRAMRQGRAAGDVRRGVRAVAWERAVGQLVQVALTLLVLLIFPSSVHAAMPIVATVLAVALCIVAALHLVGARLRLASKRAWVEVGVASIVAVGCYTSIFVIAARTAGSTASIDPVAATRHGRAVGHRAADEYRRLGSA